LLLHRRTDTIHLGSDLLQEHTDLSVVPQVFI
jgi:hypothetical protein